MSKVLVLAEFSGGTLSRTTLSAIAAARKVIEVLGGGYSILLMGSKIGRAARELVTFGAERVLVCDHEALACYTAESYAATVAGEAGHSELLICTASSFGKDLIPRVAARLDAGYAGDTSAICANGGQLVFERAMFAGNIIGLCTLSTRIQTVTVRQSEFSPAEPLEDAVMSPIEVIPLRPPGEAANRIEFISFNQFPSERPELTEARAVVVGGRPLKDRFFRVLDPLADELKAAIGATRAVCEGGYAPDSCQVGQTGKVVAPELYVALGVSGTLQHVAGMRKSRVVVAINRDPEAPIFQVSDYGLVADLFEVTPTLVRAIRNWRGLVQ